MAADPTTASFICPITGEQDGAANLLLEWAIAAPFNYSNPILLTPSGFTALSPGVSGATVYALLLIIPPTDNVQTLTLKGQAGDVGFEISPTEATVVAGVTAGLLGIELGAGLAVTILTRWL